MYKSGMLWVLWCMGLMVLAAPDPRRGRGRSAVSGDGSPAMSRLLRVFGLERPGRRQRHAATPQYMLDLYDSVADRRTGVTTHVKPYNADIVRSFHDSDSPHDLTHFRFLVNGQIGPEESLLAAEFHVYKLKPKNLMATRNSSGRLLKETKNNAHLLEMRVYQVIDPSLANQELGNKLLDARRISAYSPGWEVFRVKDAVMEWLKNESTNHGLLLTLHSLVGETMDASILRVVKRRHPNGRQPILVLFSSSGNSNDTMQQGQRSPKTQLHHLAPESSPFYLGDAPSSMEQRTRRSSQLSSPAVDSSALGSTPELSSAVMTSGSSSECARYELLVDFEQIGWSGWIISPKSYQAFYCSGQCTYPLGQSQKPTNHATVQSIVYEMGLHDGGVQPPCCVPNKLLAISLLYFDENGNVILKQYDGMVAASCGCH